MQLITLFSLIEVPTLPKKLLDFYNGMGIANMNFLPNVIQIINAYDHEYVNGPDNRLLSAAKYDSNIF